MPSFFVNVHNSFQCFRTHYLPNLMTFSKTKLKCLSHCLLIFVLPSSQTTTLTFSLSPKNHTKKEREGDIHGVPPLFFFFSFLLCCCFEIDWFGNIWYCCVSASLDWTIFGYTLTGATWTLSVSPNDTIRDVRLQLIDKGASNPRIIFAGKELLDDATLSDCGVQRESTLHVVETSPPPKPAKKD